MTKLEQKNLATSLTTMVFLVIGTTGVLMFFHLFDKYTKELHEILGLAFVIIVFFHVFYNWTSMKSYFRKKLFLLSFALVFIISISFIINTKEGENPKTKIINLVLNASIEKSVGILGTDIEQIKGKLKSEGNPLGVIKFTFPNKYSVYMHDTDKREYFAEPYRAFSSGCVRLQEPVKLFSYILGTSEDVNLSNYNKQNKAEVPVSLKKEVPVVFRYMTAGVNKNGNLEIYDDIYGYDENNIKAMKGYEKIFDTRFIASPIILPPQAK